MLIPEYLEHARRRPAIVARDHLRMPSEDPTQAITLAMLSDGKALDRGNRDRLNLRALP